MPNRYEPAANAAIPPTRAKPTKVGWDDHGYERRHYPRQLEARFELREGAPVIGGRRVALHDRVEGQPATGGGKAETTGQECGDETTRRGGGEDAEHGGARQGEYQHRLFPHNLAETRAGDVAEQGAEGGQQQHHAEPQRRVVGAAEHERDLEVRNPTLARNNAIADAAANTPAECSSAFSSAPAAARAPAVFGSCMASTTATA